MTDTSFSCKNLKFYIKVSLKICREGTTSVMEDIIKMHEVGCEGMDWFHLAQEIVQ
jgi:hypothetical protein